MLIVGGSPAEVTLAAELADLMNSDWDHRRKGSRREPHHRTAQSRPPESIRTSPPSGPYPVPRPSSGHRLGHSSFGYAARGSSVSTSAGPRPARSLGRPSRRAGPTTRCPPRRSRHHFGALGGPCLPSSSTAHSTVWGREGGVGYIVIGLPHTLDSLADRAGDVAEFWCVKVNSQAV